MSDCTIFLLRAVFELIRPGNFNPKLSSNSMLRASSTRYNEAFTHLRDIAEQTRENEGMMVKRFMTTQSMSFIRSKRGGARGAAERRHHMDHAAALLSLGPAALIAIGRAFHASRLCIGLIFLH